MSRGFVAALVGIAITVLAYFGPWEWPSWPVFAVMDLTFGSYIPFADMSFTPKAAVVVGLLTLNVTVWGLVAYAAISLFSRLRAGRVKLA